MWEFQAVVRGRCAPVFAAGREELAERKLWAFSPGNAHGWTGEAGKTCEVYVFHFEAVPEGMQRLVPRDSSAEARLDDAEIRRVRRIYRRLRESGGASDVLGALHELESLVSLCLIIASRLAPSVQVGESRPGNLVKSSLAWYEDHMASGPRLTTVARQTNISVSHLRRLYRSVLHESPSSELAKRRFSRAKYLLAVTSLSISEIADATGYGSASAFSRAFRKGVGISPDGWRRGQRAGPLEWQP
jgi:AraC-like DNA-binding protein